MNLQIGDYVIIDSESTSYFQERGIVQSIDIYGNVKVKIGETNIKVKRDEVRPVFNKNSSPYLNNKGFIAFQERCRNSITNQETGSKVCLKQQIDLSLDTKDKKWFLQLTNKLTNFD